VRWKGPLTREQVEENVGTTGGFTIPTWRQRGGLVWILLLLLLVALVLSGGLPGRGGRGVNLRRVLEPFPAAPSAAGRLPASRGRVLRFVPVVAYDVQRTWRQLFRQARVRYQAASLVRFERSKLSDCGSVSRLTGPTYCRFDRKLYLELPFFRELSRGFGTAGDFAQAYVIAHLFGHHVQNLLGITDQVRRGQEASPNQSTELQRRLEFQADCLAGVWAHSAYPQRLLGTGALEKGFQAVRTVATVRVLKESAEGWSLPVASKARWFRRGFRGGKAGACDTFAADVDEKDVFAP
jgi:uncharacterized protein